MDALPPAGWTDVATRSDLRDVRSELKTEIAELRSELKTDMAELKTELKTEMAELRAEVREGFARTVSREELGEVLRLHVDARVGAISRWWIFSAMGMQAATIAGMIAAVRL